MGPDIGAVVCHKDGDVADNAHSALGSVAVQRRPLLKEEVLQVLEPVDFCRQRLAPLSHRSRGAVGDVALPGRPHGTLMRVLEGHKQGIVVEPGRLLLAKGLEPRQFLRRAAADPVVKGRGQQ